MQKVISQQAFHFYLQAPG